MRHGAGRQGSRESLTSRRGVSDLSRAGNRSQKPPTPFGIQEEELNFCVCTPAVPNLFGIRDWFHGRQFFHGPGPGRGMCRGRGRGDGSSGSVSDGEQRTELHSTARLPLTSCCVARFLTGLGPVPIRDRVGLETPGINNIARGAAILSPYSGLSDKIPIIYVT